MLLLMRTCIRTYRVFVAVAIVAAVGVWSVYTIHTGTQLTKVTWNKMCTLPYQTKLSLQQKHCAIRVRFAYSIRKLLKKSNSTNTKKNSTCFRSASYSNNEKTSENSAHDIMTPSFLTWEFGALEFHSSLRKAHSNNERKEKWVENVLHVRQRCSGGSHVLIQLPNTLTHNT